MIMLFSRYVETLTFSVTAWLFIFARADWELVPVILLLITMGTFLTYCRLRHRGELYDHARVSAALIRRGDRIRSRRALALAEGRVPGSSSSRPSLVLRSGSYL